jgi:hypothetical protein
VAGNEARNIAVNVAVIKKLVAVIFAESGNEGLQRSGNTNLFPSFLPFINLLFTFCMYQSVGKVLCSGYRDVGGGGTVR